MNRRLLSIIGLSVLAVAAAAAWALQRQELAALRIERDKALAARESAAHLAVSDAVPPTASVPPLTPEENLELMRLRNQVSTLRERQRALAGVSNENAALRTQLAQVDNYAAGRLPPGYIRRKDARFVGTASPDTTLESLLWSIEHRDTNRLFELFQPEAAQQLSHEIERNGSEQFFKQAGAIAGARIVSRIETGPDAMELQVEIIPGSTDPMKLRRIDGGWRLESL